MGISYDADIRQAKNVIETLILEETARIPEEAYSVYVDSLGESAVNIGARVWVKTEDYWETKWRLTENIKYALDENHIEIPYPQMSVHMRQSDSKN